MHCKEEAFFESIGGVQRDFKPRDQECSYLGLSLVTQDCYTTLKSLCFCDPDI